MLSKLELINFGPHARTSIRFGKGVNTLVGLTDAGKSWIIRAMEWVTFNSYKGKDFIKHGQSHVEVRATFSDGVHVSRVKSKRENNYYVGKQPYKAGASAPPQKVEDALNLARINFFGQEDGLFFLSMSPPERGRYVNQLANIDIIDTSASNIATVLREERGALTAREEELDEVREELEKYKGLEELEGKLQVAIATEQVLLQKRRERRGLEQTIKEIEKTKKQIKELPDTTGIMKLIRKAQKVLESLSVIETRAGRLENDLAEIEETEEKLARTKKRLGKEEKMLKQSMPEVCPLCDTELN